VESKLELDILPQPDETTCGPTCLHAVYRYYGYDDAGLERVVSEVVPLETGGTLAVWLACHALPRGFSAVIYSYNVQLFDPTWFDTPAGIPERRNPAFGTDSRPSQHGYVPALGEAVDEFFGERHGECRMVNDEWRIDPESPKWVPNDFGCLNSVLTVE